MLFAISIILLFAINTRVFPMDHDYRSRTRTTITVPSYNNTKSKSIYSSQEKETTFYPTSPVVDFSEEKKIKSEKSEIKSSDNQVTGGIYNTVTRIPQVLSQVKDSGLVHAKKVAAYGFTPLIYLANAIESMNAQSSASMPSWPARGDSPSGNPREPFGSFDSSIFAMQQGYSQGLLPEKFLKKEELEELAGFFRNSNFDINKMNRIDLIDLSSALICKVQDELHVARGVNKKAATINNGLVIDSIEPEVPWETSFDISEKKSKKFCVRKIQSYTPSNVKDVNNSNSVVMIVTHGTFGSWTEDYFKDNFVKEQKIQNYRHFKRFATWYGFTHKKRVTLYSMKWSGDLSDSARFKCSDYLANYLKEHCSENDQLVFLSHSHGCNAINNLSRKLQRPIDLIIHFACPNRRDEIEYHPQNFRKLIHFYSAGKSLLEGDVTEPAGRIKEKDIVNYLIKNIALYGAVALASLTECEMIANIIYKAASTNLEIDKQSIKNTVFPDNYFLPQDNAVVIGLKTRINGKSPWHSRVPDVAQLLPELMTKIYKEYPAHVAYSFRGDLHMEGDGRHNYSSNNPIKISNLQIALPHFLPKSIPCIVMDTSHIPTEQLPEFYKQMQLRSLQDIGLDHWFDEKDPAIDPLVKPYDEHNRMIALQAKDNKFTDQDLENERKKSIAEAPNYIATERKPTFIQDIN